MTHDAAAAVIAILSLLLAVSILILVHLGLLIGHVVRLDASVRAQTELLEKTYAGPARR